MFNQHFSNGFRKNLIKLLQDETQDAQSKRIEDRHKKGQCNEMKGQQHEVKSTWDISDSQLKSAQMST